MKIKEELIDGEGTTFHVKSTFDPNPTLKSVGEIRQLFEHNVKSDYRHVGRVPGWLIAEWCKQAGVKWSDVHARNEIVKRKLMSGEYNAFRNWMGRW